MPRITTHTTWGLEAVYSGAIANTGWSDAAEPDSLPVEPSQRYAMAMAMSIAMSGWLLVIVGLLVALESL